MVDFAKSKESPDLSRSLMLSIVSSYCIRIKEERSVVLYPSVSMLPKTIHLRITSFLMPNPGLLIQLPSLFFGINSVEVKKSVDVGGIISYDTNVMLS